MDESTRRNTCHVNEDDIDEIIIEDNRKLSLEKAGQKTNEMDENGGKSLIMEIYPWIGQFKKMCRNSLSQRSMSTLSGLMAYYARNIRPSVIECHTKPLRAEKLKDSIGDTLLFFLYYYRDVADKSGDHRDSYMNIMSDLMALYIDMELKASKKGNEHCTKISARLSSCLHVYLDNSAEHLLDTLLKVHFMNNNYHEILDPVITKIFKSIDEQPNSSIMYVRYLLAYRLWKKLSKDVAVRNQINMIAVSSLGTAPSDFSPFILESVLPKVPKSQKLSTKLLLLQKFELEKSCEEFLGFCRRERDLKASKPEDETIATCLLEDKDSHESLTNNSISNNSSQLTQTVTDLTALNEKKSHETRNNSVTIDGRSSISAKKLVTRKSLKKFTDIEYIDLTSDNISEKVIKKKKAKRKLLWLEETKKRINSRLISLKKNSAIEEAAQEPSDPLNIGSLRVSSPTRQGEQTATKSKDEKVRSEDTTSMVDLSMDTLSAVTTTVLEVTSPRGLEWSQLERQKNERNRSEATRGRIETSPIDAPISEKRTEEPVEKTEGREKKERTGKEAQQQQQRQNSTSVEYCKKLEKSINDSRDHVKDDSEDPEISRRKREEEAVQEDKTSVARTLPVEAGAIKPERVNVEPSEIMNEIATGIEVPVAEYAADLSLHCERIVEAVQPPAKVQDNEFQENIDGLSLLASVSQRVSHLTTDPGVTNAPVELIKVKNYASLANLPAAKEVSETQQQFPLNASNMNKIVGIYPEDTMGKVAYQVEVTSSEIDPYANCVNTGLGAAFPSVDETCCNGPPVMSAGVETGSNLTEKDEANVILNGETVVLFQKSPNSNLYIINKAVENRGDHDDSSEHVNESVAFPYEMYDTIYRNPSSNYELSQYKNRDLSSKDSRRGKKGKSEREKGSDVIGHDVELSKPIKIDPAAEKSPRLNGKSALSGRRRRIKQEFNQSHHQTNGYQDRAQEHVESPMHIPVGHNNPLSSMYPKYPTATELYIPCHKSCNSITCPLPPVNTGANIHSHSGKTAAPNSHCGCLNCAYGIVTHCAECIIPNGESRNPTIDPNSYYLPIHSGQNTNVQDCGRTNVPDETNALSKIYDDQLVCKYEQRAPIIDVNKGLDKCKPNNEIYRSQIDNKLPLKKRFKAMMSSGTFDDVPIKREKIQSYPSTPMLSIAALEASQEQDKCASGDDKSSLELPAKVLTSSELRISQQHQSREMIRRDYHKELLMMGPPTAPLPNGFYPNGTKRKRKAQNSIDCGLAEIGHEDKIYDKIGNKTCQQDSSNNKYRDIMSSGVPAKKACYPTNKTQSRPSAKVKEPEGGSAQSGKKKSTRKTRSSKRNVPKVDYIYSDGDSDWNPSGVGCGNSVTKRKRKKTSR